jgi:hypothetical protein
MGVAVKHQQLSRQVGVFIEHPLENLIASLSFTSTVLDEGTTFIFGSCICVANGLGGFNNHLVDSRKPEASTSTRSSDLDELLLPDLHRQIEKTSVFDATSTHAAPVQLGSDPNRSEEASRSKSLSDLEEDLDRLFKIRDEGATAPRGPPILDYNSKNEEYLQVRAEEDSRTGEPPLIGRPQSLTTTRNPMITLSCFPVIIQV